MPERGPAGRSFCLAEAAGITDADEVEFIVYKVGKMDGDFADNLKEYLANNPKYTKKETKLTTKDIDKFNMQYPRLEVRYADKFHDRFLILDRKYIYHIGASLKDLGKKCFGITLIKYDAIIEDILKKVDI